MSDNEGSPTGSPSGSPLKRRNSKSSGKKSKKRDLDEQELEKIASLITVDGFIHVYDEAGARWLIIWATLVGGSMFVYYDVHSPKPKYVYRLSNFGAIESVDEAHHRTNCFRIAYTSSDEDTTGMATLFSTSDRTECAMWTESLEASREAEPVEKFARNALMRKRSSTLKSVADKLSSTGVGKASLKTILNDDAKDILGALKQCVGKVGDKKDAKSLDRDVIKLLVKIYFLEKSGAIKMSELLACDVPARRALDTLVWLMDEREKMNDGEFHDKIGLVLLDIRDVETGLAKLLAPHVSQKTLLRLTGLFDFVSRREFIESVMTSEDCQKDLGVLKIAMKSYVAQPVFF